MATALPSLRSVAGCLQRRRHHHHHLQRATIANGIANLPDTTSAYVRIAVDECYVSGQTLHYGRTSMLQLGAIPRRTSRRTFTHGAKGKNTVTFGDGRPASAVRTSNGKNLPRPVRKTALAAHVEILAKRRMPSAARLLGPTVGLLGQASPVPHCAGAAGTAGTMPIAHYQALQFNPVYVRSRPAPRVPVDLSGATSHKPLDSGSRSPSKARLARPE